MEDGDVQSLLETFIEPYTTAELISSEGVHAEVMGEFDSQCPDCLLENYFPPLDNQLVHHSAFPEPHPQQYYWSLETGPTALSPWHISGASVQDTPIPHMTDENRGDDEFGGGGGGGGFTEDQIWANGFEPRPGRVPLRITSQEDSFRGTNSPSDQIDVNDVQLCNPNPPFTTTDSQSLHVPPQQSEDIPGTRPNSPFEHWHHPDQRPGVEAPESSGLQRIPEMETVKGSRIKLIDSQESGLSCDYADCNRICKRPQELGRHKREIHGISPRCPICGVKWKRAEKIREHLRKIHQDYFDEEQHQRISQLKGFGKTIDFLEEWLESQLAINRTRLV